MATSPQSPSLQRLYLVEKRIVHAVELAGSVMEEMGNAAGPRKDVLASQCQDFMKSVKDIQTILHDEIKSMCEYRPYENCDYVPRIGAEISLKKLDRVLEQLDNIEESIRGYHHSAP